MGIQTEVKQVIGLGEVGSIVDTASTGLINAAPACRVNGSAKVGGFVWTTSAPAGTVVNSLEQFVTANGSGSPLGFVYRVQDGALPYNEGYTLNVANGQPCPVAIRGRFLAKASTNATVGQKVLADTENGSIVTGSAAITAAAGTLEFKTVSAYGGWTSTSAGKLKLKIDGEEYALTGLNFGSVDSLAAVATVLDTALTNVADVAVNTATTGLIFTSKTTGSASKVEYIAETGDIGTLLGASTSGNVEEVDGVSAKTDTGFVVKTAATIGNLFIVERY